MLKVPWMTKHAIEAPKAAVTRHSAAQINELVVKTRKLSEVAKTYPQTKVALASCILFPPDR